MQIALIIPRATNSNKVTYTVRNNVRVTVERSLWVTILSLIAGQVPDDERLVARTRQEHIWVLERSRKRGDPAAVALEGALEDKLFRHVGVLIWLTEN